MISLKECNTQIKALQYILSHNKTMTNIERISVYDTLTFYLDMRALLVMKNCSNSNEEQDNDLAN